ncbi:MAG: hypothetical protein KJ058_11425 [Thermoanaerobaculia bacterium]|nr:hypothetical protein [Thermoanaerobaculia bacterium]
MAAPGLPAPAPRAGSPGARAALAAIRALHTAVWAFFVACIAAVFVFAWRGRFAWALAAAGIVLVEVLVLALNRMRCPLTPIAARFTPDRHASFDIYLPEWLAARNKEIFGPLYLAGVVYLLLAWLRAV